MDFELTEEQHITQQIVRGFAQAELAPHIREWDRQGGYPRRVLARMAELGLLGGPIPEVYGGAGMDYESLALTCEELERVDSCFRVILSVHVGLNSLTLLQWGTEEQKLRYLVPQAQGKKIATFGLTEPGCGSDAASIQTTAKRDGNDYILNGQKMWISLADIADHFLVFATIDRSLRHKGICAFIVERQFPGVATGTIHGKLGIRAGNTGMIYLSNVRVPKENLLGQEGEGFTIAMSALDNGRFTVAAGAVGLAQACLDASVAYARQREAFGQPIGRFELIQEMIANMVAGIEAGRLLVMRAAYLKNRGLRNTRETSLAKWYCTEMAMRAALDAVQIHGAYGYSDEYPVERYLRNAKGEVIYEGTSQIHQVLQAEYALGYRVDKPLRCPPAKAQGY